MNLLLLPALLAAGALLAELVRPATPRTRTIRCTPSLQDVRAALLDVAMLASLSGYAPARYAARRADNVLSFTLQEPGGLPRVCELAARFCEEFARNRRAARSFAPRHRRSRTLNHTPKGD